MTLLDYLPVLIQILLAVGMGFGILFASHIFGQKAIAGKIKVNNSVDGYVVNDVFQWDILMKR